MKVLVCDDRASHCRDVVGRIEALELEGVTVEGICGANGEDLKAEIEALFRRVRLSLGEEQGPDAIVTKFDEADLVLLDNNLAYLHVEGIRFTAESIIGYIRAFTMAGYVVSLNKNPEVDFDLRLLVGDYASRADLALNDRHLASRWLWQREAGQEDAFRPWYWPTLLSEPARRREQITFVRKNIDSPILEALGFPEASVAMLSRHALGALSPEGELGSAGDGGATSAAKITFRQMFLYSTRAIPDRTDRENLDQRSRSCGVHADIVSRAVAADVDFWILRDVVGPQDVLVDVPHLLTRMPFLLGGGASDLGAWNAHTIVRQGTDDSLPDTRLAKYRFGFPCWVRSPSFWWIKVSEDEELSNLFYEDDGGWLDVVFCEDVSGFVDRDGPDGEAVREFVAEFEGPWERRYVRRLTNLKYAPRSRFAL